jgi:hypothetical protein
MKTIHSFAQRLLAGAVALAVLGLATHSMAQSSPQLVAKIIRVKGMARYSRDNKTWQTVKVGDILQPGSVIQTAEKATVDIQLGERDAAATTPISNSGMSGMGYSPEEATANVVRIFESSVLGVDKLTSQQTGADTVEETQLDLRAGNIMGNVKKLSAASKYEVKIPNGVAGIRGTIYFISSSGVVNVMAGSVVIAVVGADGTVVTKVVTSWHRYDPMTGLLTEILPKDRADLIKKAHDLTGPGQTPPTTYTHDHTIIHVSPIHGHDNDQGDNNNNQGP